MDKSNIVVIIMLGVLASSVSADTTYVSGIINTNTVWNPAGSPYVITGNVLVNTGVRLDIQPGVKVLFTANKYIMVKGTLKAIGTAQDSITFTAIDTLQRWGRLWFKPEAFACSLKYCKITYACSSAVRNEDTLYIGYSRITNNSAVSGGGIDNSGTATITNNTISNNYADYGYGGGIYNYYSGTATITNNTITNNSAAGGGGICNYYGTATITNNTITNNYADFDGGGIYNSGTATITNNTIIDSTASTIRNDYGSIRLNYNNLNNLRPTGYTVYNNSADTINARNNYWFTLDTNVIKQKIYDFWDDFTSGEVYYRPFLTAPIGIEEENPKPMDVCPSRTIYYPLKICPNPAKSYFIVRCPSTISQIRIYDITGKLIKEEKFKGSKETKVFLADIKTGIYFVKVNDAMLTEKLVITR
ncbi:MAG: T9SS type A sorting domain-containing protein [candidate division WOR-3 bacterium]|nr:T9SS type A sorting domain-containing protein [candidate division WOR-3 bacterium]